MSTYSQYTIKSGDTLSKIAAQSKTSVATLVKINGINNPNLIRAGSSILIPVPDEELQEVIVTASPGGGLRPDQYRTSGGMEEIIVTAIRDGKWFEPPKVYYLLGGLAAILMLSGRKQ
jgi:LysM repeat protein